VGIMAPPALATLHDASRIVMIGVGDARGPASHPVRVASCARATLPGRLMVARPSTRSTRIANKRRLGRITMFSHLEAVRT
jgi:hypothetical protein